MGALRERSEPLNLVWEYPAEYGNSTFIPLPGTAVTAENLQRQVPLSCFRDLLGQSEYALPAWFQNRGTLDGVLAIGARA